MLVGPITTGLTTGGSGSSSVTAYSKSIIKGLVRQIQVAYHGSPPATTDVVIKTKGTNSPSITLLTLTDGNTDVTKAVVVQCVTTAGVTATGAFQPLAIEDYLQIDVSGSNDGAYVDVYLYVTPILE
jgi:hypothetical protein